jgi:multidrug resistance efflux pump
MRPSHNAPEAPTHLRAGDLPPGLLDDPPTCALTGHYSVSAHPTLRRVEPTALPALPPYDQDPDQPSLVSVSRSRSRSRSGLAAGPRVPTEPASGTPPSRRVQSTPAPALRAPQSTPRAASVALPTAATGASLSPAPASRASKPTPHMRKPVAAPVAQPQPAPRSASVAQPQPARSASVAQPQPARSASVAQPTPHSKSVPQATPHSKSVPQATPHSKSASQPGGRPASQPTPHSHSNNAGAAAPALPAGLGAVDPMAISTPPELAGPIYSYIRRLALQADLTGADRVLRDALAELTSSLSCTIVYPGQEGLWSLGSDDEVPREATPLVAVATARRAVIASHTAMIPVVTTSETVAVITLTRNARQPAYQPIEQIAMVALAREAAPILHHLAVQYLQHSSEIKADKGSLYRGEALEAHRKRGQEGQLVQLSPAWVKRAYPLLIATIIIAVLFAVFIRVPTYSTGTAVIMFEGSTSVTAALGGTVEKVLVKANEEVKQGDPLVQLSSPEEAAQLAAAETEWRDMKIQFLFDQSDEQIRKSLMSAATSRDHARARVEARTIRAPRDGVVTNLHAKEGVAIQPGGYLMQITDENSEIEVLAFLPGKDGPRIRDTMGVKLLLDGYTKGPVTGAITHIQPNAISAPEAAKLGGEMLAETIAADLKAGGTWITVRARLPSRTFKAEHNTYHYHHGMHAKAEVKILSKPFLVTLLPALEKYLPD